MSRIKTGSLLPHLLVGLTLPATAWAFFCPGTLSAGETDLVLLGEQLLIDQEDPGAGAVVGTYRASNGHVISVECTGGPSHHDMNGDFA